VPFTIRVGEILRVSLGVPVQFVRFCIVGVLGFFADAGMTLAMTQLIHAGPMPGRVVAFVSAASLTWYLNRRYTFRSDGGNESWAPYVLLTAFGALINIGVYHAWLQAAGTAPEELVIGVALGSVVALAFNFSVSRYVVFR
jgi:putative flippase GtrA